MLQVLLDTRDRRAFLLLTADWARGKPVPSLSSIWPYAQWWEEELSAFEALEFSGADDDAGVAWRRN
jgi:NADH:ubiquinone oxidoreductase subunit C